MRDIQEFYVLGIPIQTDIGECTFIKVWEYPDYIVDLLTVAMTKNSIIHKYIGMNENGYLTEYIEELKKADLFTIVGSIPELQQAYFNLFRRSFNNDEAIAEINSENFHYYRNLILKINCTKEDNANPNPEIQAFIEASRKAKLLESDNLEFADMVSSIVGYNGLTYDDINNFTIYQLYMTFYRIGHFKNYDTSSLFATVSDKVKIESWSKHINLFEEEKNTISQKEFRKTTGSIISE